MTLFLDLSLNESSEKEQCNAFLYLIGAVGRDIHDSFTFLASEKDKLKPLFDKFNKYCSPKQNTIVERHKFNTRERGKEESIEQYVANLKLIAKGCNYGNLEQELIRDRIVCGTNSTRIKERLLREDELTLDKAITICRADEESKEQIKKLSEDIPSVHGVRKFQKQKGKWEGKQSKQHIEGKQATSNTFSCRNCGTKHAIRQCPAYGKTCHKCQKLNHYQKYCKSKKVFGIDNENTETQAEAPQQKPEVFFIGSIGEDINANSVCFATLPIEGKEVKFKIDTGSQANIIPLNTFKTLPNYQKIPVRKTNAVLTSYSNDNIPCIGKCSLTCKETNQDFYIVDTSQTPILSCKTSQVLELIKVLNVNISDIETEFPKLFQGLGCLDTPYHIEIDPSASPVIDAPRKVPVALRDRLKSALDNMCDQEVIRKVDEPTEWVNSIVIVEKTNSNKLRICLDPTNLNKAIKREHFQIPTIEEIMTRISGAQIFSKVDANSGYYQIPLDMPSQLLTTFQTPFGRYCFTRMPFGIKSAQEVFQKRMYQHFHDLPGVETDIDDLLIWGRTDEEHSHNLRACLKRCQDIHMTLNKEKCTFGVEEVKYIGHCLTKEGVKPDPDKIEAILKMPEPVDKKGVERMLGFMNYLAKFIPNLSEITSTMRSMLKKDCEFEW